MRKPYVGDWNDSVHSVRCEMKNNENEIRPIDDIIVEGIGGRDKGIGIESIDIPFLSLHLIVKVLFLILTPTIPALFSMRYIITNGLYLSLQGQKI